MGDAVLDLGLNLASQDTAASRVVLPSVSYLHAACVCVRLGLC